MSIIKAQLSSVSVFSNPFLILYLLSHLNLHFMFFTKIGGGSHCWNWINFVSRHSFKLLSTSYWSVVLKQPYIWYQGSLPRLYTICILHQNLFPWTALVQSNTPTFKLYLRITRFLLNRVFISKIKGSLYEWSDRSLKADRSTIIYNNPQMSCGAIRKQN